jgi:hypothetical protein
MFGERDEIEDRISMRRGKKKTRRMFQRDEEMRGVLMQLGGSRGGDVSST